MAARGRGGWGRLTGVRAERRWGIVALCFLCMLCIYVERVGFSIAYTAIATTRNVDETAKGIILGAFFNGYAISQVPGGWAAHRFGGKVVLNASFAAWSVLSLMTPLVMGWTGAMVALRALMGVAQGFVVPSVHTIIAQWIPPQERATATSLATSGMYLGSTSAMLLLPALVASTGPAAVPVLVGGMGLGWLTAWIAVGSDGPGHDPTASSSPSGLLPLTGDLDSSKDRQRRRPSAAPWGRMLRTPALLAIVINNFTFHYALYILMNWMPTYFSRLLRAELATMGPAKSAPYLAIFAFSIAAGYAGDWLIVRRGLSVATARKIINTAGFAAASVSLLFIPFATSTRWAVTHVAVSLAAVGFARGGFSVNHMDIAPRFAGAVMGVSNTAGTLAGVIGLPVTGWLLEAGGGAANVEGWRNACLVASILCAAGAVVFIVFGRGDRVIG